MKIVLLVLFLFLSLLYFPLNKRKCRFYWHHWLDDYIPTVPVFIVPYVLFFGLKIFSIVYLWNSRYAEQFLWSLDLSYATAAVFWYVYPNGVKRTFLAGNSLWVRMINLLYTHDADGNGLPSAHVFLTLNSIYYLVLVYPQHGIGLWVFALSICASTVLIKQHYILDVVGGIIWSICSILLASLISYPV